MDIFKKEYSAFLNKNIKDIEAVVSGRGQNL